MAAKYSDTITTRTGSAIEGATVQIFDNGALVALYADNGLTTPLSPDPHTAVSDVDGYVECYLAPGTYTVVQSDGGVTKSFANVQLYDLTANDAAVANTFAKASAIGITPSDTDLGTFTGSTIPDNGSVKGGMQALETALEAGAGGLGPFSQAAAYAAGTVGDFLQNLYAVQSAGAVNFGNKPDGSAAAIRIGSNDAFTGTGILQIGGAGIKDGGHGAYFGSLGHPNWPALQSSLARNPVELAIYSNGASGIGTSSGTTTFTATSGTFTSADVGRAIWLNGSSYTISSFTDATHVVLNSAPPAATYVWHIVKTTGSGTCTVASGVCTRVTGDPFIAHTFGSGFTFKLNGTAYTVSADGGANSCTISSPPADGTYSYSYETDINDQLAAFRVGPQFPGSDEENVTLMARTMRYELRTLYSGNGAYRDLIIGSGEYSTGNLAEQLACHSDGTLILQGVGSKTVRLGGAIAADRMFNVSRNAGYFGGIRLETASVARFDFAASNDAETGSNVGSNLIVNSFTDGGAFLETPFKITRSTGLTTLKNLDFLSGGVIKINGTQVVEARDTGWSAMTGSSDKSTAFATGSVTLAQLAGRVMALQAALTAHGLIGA